MAASQALLDAFRRAAVQVPAYRQILAEAGVDPSRIRSPHDFARQVPVIDKAATFGRFGMADLCCGGQLGRVAFVLTSSGHSGRFAYGLYPPEDVEAAAQGLDDALDAFLGVRSHTTLLINCLPMGVKVYTQACTLAETSVRADMVTAIVAEFGRHYDQMILVGEAAFVKHTLELGQRQGIDWGSRRVHIVVGEEPLAENARAYLRALAGIRGSGPEGGTVISSMGVAEIGLNLFSETPTLIAVRGALHRDAGLRRAALGPAATNVPMLFTYDPGRIFVEVDDDRRLIVTTLSPDCHVPLIRYATGDEAEWLTGNAGVAAAAEAAGLGRNALADVPVLCVGGRGQYALAGDARVYPEQVKEGLYRDPALAGLTTANFRLASGPESARLRIQLSPGVAAEPSLAGRYAAAISAYAAAPLDVTCEPYESFDGGMALDYERKFDYLGRGD